MNREIADNALMHPFSVLRRIGFSTRLMQRLERHRSQQEKRGRVVSVLSWADGTWCALSLHCEKTARWLLTKASRSTPTKTPARCSAAASCPCYPCAGKPMPETKTPPGAIRRR
jgi:hypothetical protein